MTTYIKHNKADEHRQWVWSTKFYKQEQISITDCIKCLHGIVNGDHVSLPPLTDIQVNIQPSRHHPRPLSSQGYSRWVAGQLFSVSNSVYVSASAIM